MRERFTPTANKKAAEYSSKYGEQKSYLFVFTLVLRAGQTFWPKINIQVASYCYYHTLASAVYRHPLFSHSTACIFFNKKVFFPRAKESEVIPRSDCLSYRGEESLRINSLLISYSKFILATFTNSLRSKRILYSLSAAGEMA